MLSHNWVSLVLMKNDSAKNDKWHFLEVFTVNAVRGARGGVVVKALRYEPAGCGFDSRWCHWNFSIT
jgi:hypothetical protein